MSDPLENTKTRAKWNSLGRNTLGPATHYLIVHGDKIFFWHEDRTTPKRDKLS